MLNVDGERRRPMAGSPVRRPRRLVEVSQPRAVRHLLRWFPAHKFQITLEDIGALVRQWDEEDKCYTCDGTGTIQEDRPNHLYVWARTKGNKCLKCSGHGRVIRLYEERLSLPKSFVRRTQLMFRDADGVMHAVTKKGRTRTTRCKLYRELYETFLTGYGQVTCVACIAWRP